MKLVRLTKKEKPSNVVAAACHRGADGKWYEGPEPSQTITQPTPATQEEEEPTVLSILEKSNPTTPEPKKDVSLRSGMGWIVASFLFGLVIYLLMWR